jgi:hypothetical protein
MRALAPESPFDVTRRGFAVGTAVLDAVRPASAGPTDVVPGEAQLATLKVYLFGKMAGPDIHVPRSARAERGVVGRRIGGTAQRTKAPIEHTHRLSGDQHRK